MYDQLKSLWDQVLQYLSSEKNISNLSFKEWIKNSNVTEESTEDNLIIELPNDFARDWVEKKYSGILSEALEQHGILGGLPVEGGILWCATEKVSRAVLDETAAVVKEVLSK